MRDGTLFLIKILKKISSFFVISEIGERKMIKFFFKKIIIIIINGIKEKGENFTKRRFASSSLVSSASPERTEHQGGRTRDEGRTTHSEPGTRDERSRRRPRRAWESPPRTTCRCCWCGVESTGLGQSAGAIQRVVDAKIAVRIEGNAGKGRAVLDKVVLADTAMWRRRADWRSAHGIAARQGEGRRALYRDVAMGTNVSFEVAISTARPQGDASRDVQLSRSGTTLRVHRPRAVLCRDDPDVRPWNLTRKSGSENEPDMRS